jgi:hypothetical protein
MCHSPQPAAPVFLAVARRGQNGNSKLDMTQFHPMPSIFALSWFLVWHYGKAKSKRLPCWIRSFENRFRQQSTRWDMGVAGDGTCWPAEARHMEASSVVRDQKRSTRLLKNIQSTAGRSTKSVSYWPSLQTDPSSLFGLCPPLSAITNHQPINRASSHMVQGLWWPVHVERGWRG